MRRPCPLRRTNSTIWRALITWQRAAKLIDQLNQLIPAEQPKLYAPDLKFNRSIGEHVGKTYSVTGECVNPEEYQKHL